VKRFALLAGIGLLLLAGLACRGIGAKAPKVLVLGFDGMDPLLLQQFMDEGLLPNFSKLAKGGTFKSLGTTNPPQSPVAWSTFITGLDPQEHGVFDFVHRDPKKLMPLPSLNSVENGESKLLREGVPFWRHLEEAGIPAKLVKIPANFPALEKSGTYLTDMGTPDLEGTYGTYSFYTDAPAPPKPPPRAGGRRVQVEVRDNVVRASLVGPQQESLAFRACIDKGAGAVLVEVAADASTPFKAAKEKALLKPGEWSEWIPVLFPSAPGMVKVYLQSLEPFALYVSPTNIDPGDPAVDISAPERYSNILCQECGRFYTQGMPEETAALLDGLFTDEEFLRQNQIVIDERKRLFASELAKFESGLFFFYVSSTDILSHLYWNTIDPEHPGYKKERADKYREVILGSYKLADEFLGQALQAAGDDTAVIALSDHGFAPFRKAVNLNLWLRANGYQKGTGESMAAIDWADTKAYGVGFNGLYLNLEGRESQGVVQPAARQNLLEELSAKLLKIRDPKTGQAVIAKVQILPQPEDPVLREQSPDMLVGYARGYRASWETALGDVGQSLITDNLQAWSGDHLISPDLVPGVLLANRPVNAASPHLRDLAPSLLSLYGLSPDPAWTGRSFW
jgi:predicted AlkP superfamily phosphohydrolase/phosphomutase